MTSKQMDLNLLKVAAAIYKAKNVSNAAKELGLSQSAVSHALRRLREQFGDPMFVRTSKGIAATEFAKNIENDILDLVQRASLLGRSKKTFDPLEAEGRITLATQDYVECVVGPLLQAVLAKEAPLVQLSIRPTLGDLPTRDLEDGKVDFAIAGFYKDLPEGFYQTRLFKDEFAVGVTKSHPFIRTKMSREDYYRARHALVTLHGDFKDRTAHKVGKEMRERNFVYGSYSFTGMAWFLADSDLVLTAPRLLLEQYQKFSALQIFPNPVRIEPIDVQMVWHGQTNADPLRSWFRKRLKEICSKI